MILIRRYSLIIGDAVLQEIMLQKAKITTDSVYLALKYGDTRTGDVSMSCLMMATEMDKKDTLAEYIAFSSSARDT